jgi:hypothetical protein
MTDPNTQRADVASVAPDCVLAGDTALLMRRRAQRQPCRALEQPVPGVDAITGGEDIVDAGLHARVHAQGATDTGLDPRGEPERSVRHHARHDDDDRRGNLEAGRACDDEFLPSARDARHGDAGDELHGSLAHACREAGAQRRIHG